MAGIQKKKSVLLDIWDGRGWPVLLSTFDEFRNMEA